MKSLRVAIFGKANSGKDTLGKMIHERYYKNHNMIAGIMSFAEPIKNMLMFMYPQADRKNVYEDSTLRNELIPNTNKTYRDVLKDLSLLGKSYDNNIWVNNLDHRLKSKKNTNAIITDGRFVCDFNYCKDNGFILIKIKRGVSNDTHVSETEIDSIVESNFDLVFDNNGSMENLVNFSNSYDFSR